MKHSALELGRSAFRLGDYIQFYINGIPELYVFAGSNKSPPS